MHRRDFVIGAAAVGASTLIRGVPAFALPHASAPGTRRLDDGWRFAIGDPPDAMRSGFDDATWERVTLPHTARIEALVTGAAGDATRQWQGICWYRLPIEGAAIPAGSKAFLHFEAAMNVADVWLDGIKVGHHDGGYLPFTIDISDHLKRGPMMLAARLDNRDNPITGPKPLDQLDFNTYHGLYRYVHLVVKNPLHITDPLLANRPASGGIFVTYPEVTAEQATVRVQTHVRNEHGVARTFRVRHALLNADGHVVLRGESARVTLRPGADIDVVQRLTLQSPQLWSPRSPHLYTLRTEVVSGGEAVDVEITRIGIRRIAIDREGFHINGERLWLRGTNRHQEYPWVGYAVPENAQYRDAYLIKQAGFDYIRLSHYAHAPAFMDACDELGIVVMDCIPGWQFFNADPAFSELAYRNCRDLVRRDRNHPSVVLWEVSLNETAMPPEFIRRTHQIAHEEYPGDQCFTAGWMHGYDVYIRARQHGGCPPDETQPCLVSEYGDWEYYAMTAGLHQEGFSALAPDESNSRQLRWHGERAMLQQATNFQEAHDDNRGSRAFGDGLWVMFDYNRGYAPDIESSGCMDILRVPKYAYDFFRSQRDATAHTAGAGPMVMIASEWTRASGPDIRVFSNCDEVALLLDDRLIARQRPDRDRISSHLEHPPFTFHVGAFQPGTLRAIGYIGGREVARTSVSTAGAIDHLTVTPDFAGRGPSGRGKDLLFVRAAFEDAAANTVRWAWENVAFASAAGGLVVGDNPISSDAGVASTLLELHGGNVPTVWAISVVRQGGEVRVLHASTSNQPYVVRYTTRGEVPTNESPEYAAPLVAAGLVRAGIFTASGPVVTIDERTPKSRVRGSAAPERRDPFHH